MAIKKNEYYLNLYDKAIEKILLYRSVDSFPKVDEGLISLMYFLIDKEKNTSQLEKFIGDFNDPEVKRISQLNAYNYNTAKTILNETYNYRSGI
jgi:t-SNARE complex subunit (syntaxin)